MSDFPTTPRLIRSYPQKEWQVIYGLSGPILRYKQDLYMEYECLVEVQYDGFVAPTPDGYVNDIYDNRFVHGDPGPGRHIDRFLCKGTSFVNA